MRGLEQQKLGDTNRAVIVVKNHKTGSLVHSSALVAFHVVILQDGRSQRFWWRTPPASP